MKVLNIQFRGLVKHINTLVIKTLKTKTNANISAENEHSIGNKMCQMHALCKL